MARAAVAASMTESGEAAVSAVRLEMATHSMAAQVALLKKTCLDAPSLAVQPSQGMKMLGILTQNRLGLKHTMLRELG